MTFPSRLQLADAIASDICSGFYLLSPSRERFKLSLPPRAPGIIGQSVLSFPVCTVAITAANPFWDSDGTFFSLANTTSLLLTILFTAIPFFLQPSLPPLSFFHSAFSFHLLFCRHRLMLNFLRPKEATQNKQELVNY